MARRVRKRTGNGRSQSGQGQRPQDYDGGRGKGDWHRERDNRDHGRDTRRDSRQRQGGDPQRRGPQRREPRMLKLVPGVLEIDLDQAQRGLGQFGIRTGKTSEQKPSEDFKLGTIVPDMKFIQRTADDSVECRSMLDGVELVLVYPATLSSEALDTNHKVMIIDEGRVEKRKGADNKEQEVKVYAVILADTDEQVEKFQDRIDTAADAVNAEPSYRRGEVVKLDLDLPVAGGQREFIATAPDGRVVVIHNPLLFQYASGTVPLEVRIIRGVRQGVDAQYEAEIVVEKSIAVEWSRLNNVLMNWKRLYSALEDDATHQQVLDSISNTEGRKQFNDAWIFAQALRVAAKEVMDEIETTVLWMQKAPNRRLPQQRIPISERAAQLKKEANTAVKNYDDHMKKLLAFAEPFVDVGKRQTEGGIDEAINSLREWIDIRDKFYNETRNIEVADSLSSEQERIRAAIDAVQDPKERRRLKQRMEHLEHYAISLAFAAAEVGSYDAMLEARGGESYESFMRILREAGFVVGIDPVIQAQGERNSFGSDVYVSVAKGDRLINLRVEGDGTGMVVYFDVDGTAHDSALQKFQALLTNGQATAQDIHTVLEEVYDSGTQHCTVDEFVRLLRTKVLTVEHASVQHERLFQRLQDVSMVEFVHLLNAYREEVDLSGRREFIPAEEEQFIEQVKQLTIQRLRQHLQLPDVAEITVSPHALRDTGALAVDITVPQVFVERAFVVTGRETLAATTALAKRVTAAMEAHEHKKVEGGVALREGLKGRIDDVKKLTSVLIGVPVPDSATAFAVVPNTRLDPGKFALLIDGKYHGVDAEMFSRLQQEKAITVTEGPIPYPEGAQASIEECNERFGFEPPLKLGEVFVFDYRGKGEVADAGLQPGIRLILRGYEEGDGSATGGRLSFYYEGAVDTRGEINTDFSLTYGKRIIKVGAVKDTYSVADILNALRQTDPKKPRFIRVHTREGIHGELAADPPRKVEGRDMMTLLNLPQEVIEGRMVTRFQWNGPRGQVEGKTSIAPGDVCRVIRWNDNDQDVEIAIEANNGLLVRDGIRIPYKFFEQYANAMVPAPTIVESEGERNRLYYQLLALEEKGVVIVPSNTSLLDFLEAAHAGTAPYLHVRRDVIKKVPKKGPKKGLAEKGAKKEAVEYEEQKITVSKTLHFTKWDDKEVVFFFSDESIRRTYSVPDFFIALEDRSNLLGSTSEQTHAYAEVPEQHPRLSNGPQEAVAEVELDTTDEHPEYDAPDASFTPGQLDFLHFLSREYDISVDDLTSGVLEFDGQPVLIELVPRQPVPENIDELFPKQRRRFWERKDTTPPLTSDDIGPDELMMQPFKSGVVVEGLPQLGLTHQNGLSYEDMDMLLRSRRLRKREAGDNVEEAATITAQAVATTTGEVAPVVPSISPAKERFIDDDRRSVRKPQHSEPDIQSEADEKDEQFLSYLKVKRGISLEMLQDRLYYHGQPIAVVFITDNTRTKNQALSLVDVTRSTDQEEQYVPIPHRRMSFIKKENLSYQDFIRLLDKGEITVGDVHTSSPTPPEDSIPELTLDTPTSGGFSAVRTPDATTPVGVSPVRTSGAVTPAEGSLPVTTPDVVQPVAQTVEARYKFSADLQSEFGLSTRHLDRNFLYNGKPVYIDQSFVGPEVIIRNIDMSLIEGRDYSIRLSYDQVLQWLRLGKLTRNPEGNFESTESFKKRERDFFATFGPRRYVNRTLFTYKGRRVFMDPQFAGAVCDVIIEPTEGSEDIEPGQGTLQLSFSDFLNLMKNGTIQYNPSGDDLF